METLILGVDPGTKVTGYGVLILSPQLDVLDFGCIKTPVKAPLSKKYQILFSSFQSLVKKYQPQSIAVETQYIHKNVTSAMKLYGVKAALMIVAEEFQIPIYEYTPTNAKKAVTGKGSASKRQLQETLKTLLQLTSIPEPEDASDALALAYCHANRVKWETRCMNI